MSPSPPAGSSPPSPVAPPVVASEAGRANMADAGTSNTCAGQASMQVDKIHEVRNHLAGGMRSGPHAPKRIGVVNMRATRLLAFLIIAAALLACAAICLLAVWQYVESDFAWRALASLGIISLATAVFVSLNEGFGPLVRD